MSVTGLSEGANTGKLGLSDYIKTKGGDRSAFGRLAFIALVLLLSGTAAVSPDSGRIGFESRTIVELLVGRRRYAFATQCHPVGYPNASNGAGG